MMGGVMLRNKTIILAVVLSALLISFATCAKALTFSVDLRTGVGDPAASPYITYQSPLQDSNGDGWYETVFRINLNGSPYNQATFQVHYTAQPTGSVNVNIGDSSTDDSGGGDAGTQSNDAELFIGRQQTDFNTTLSIAGRDGTPNPPGVLMQLPNFVGDGVTATFSVRNNFLAWDNHRDSFGSLTSPYLYALAGQPDTEGPVNYDIYAAFNRVVAGPYRLGTGIGDVTVTLSNVIPEPSSIVLLGFGLAGLSIVAVRRRFIYTV
jgi:hypothetical protein